MAQTLRVPPIGADVTDLIAPPIGADVTALMGGIETPTRQASAPLVTPRLERGSSPTLTVGGRRGRFNFDVPPETGGTPAARFAFDTADGGRWFFQLEKDLQGGRWDDADHAPADFERYKALDPRTRTATMAAMWGDNPIASVIDTAAGEKVSFNELRRRLKAYNTHRQISDGEPAPVLARPPARSQGAGPRAALGPQPVRSTVAPPVSTPPQARATQGMLPPSRIDESRPISEIGRNVAGALGAGAVRTNMLFWGSLEAAGDLLGLPSVSEWAKSAGKQAEEIATSVRGPQTGAGPTEQAVYSGVESMGTSIPTLLAGAATGNPTAALVLFGGVTGGQAYRTARDKGVDVPQALNYAISQGAIEAATEKIPAGRLLKDLAGKTGFLKTIIGQLATEIPGEQAATLLQDLNDWAVLNPEKPFKDYLTERPGAAQQTLIATIVGTIGQTAAVSASQRLLQEPAGTPPVPPQSAAQATAPPSPRPPPSAPPVAVQPSQATPAAIPPVGSDVTDLMTTPATPLAPAPAVSSSPTGERPVGASPGPTAAFIGWQEQPDGPRIALYNVTGGPLDGSTVSAETLQEQGIAVPEAGSFPTTGTFTVYRGGTSAEGWFTPDKPAAAEYAALDEGGTVQKRTLTVNRPASATDVLQSARDLALVDEEDVRPAYHYVQEETFGEDSARVKADLLAKGFDAIHLVTGEDFSPSGREIESWYPLTSESVKASKYAAVDIRLPAAQTEGRGVQPSESIGPGEEGDTALRRVAASLPTGRESPTAQATRRDAHYTDVFKEAYRTAKSVDPSITRKRLKAEFDARVSFLEELDREFEASGYSPRALLESIAQRGGISLDAERLGGLTGPNELLAELEDIARLGDVGARGATFPGTEELAKRAGIRPGEKWWAESWTQGPAAETAAQAEPVPLTAESYRAAFGGTKEQAEAIIAVYEAMGIPLDRVFVAKGGQPGDLTQNVQQTESAAFKRWFGDSKVVNDHGRPLVVYHGTRDDIQEFDPARNPEGGLHFGTVEHAETRAFSLGSNLVPVFLSIQNPRRSKDMGRSWRSQIASARSAGHDGIVYLNRYEGIPPSAFERARAALSRRQGSNRATVEELLGRLSDVEFKRLIPEARDSYIALTGTQIKSVFNRGTFDPRSAHILYQDAAEPPPIFYSRLRQVVDQKMPTKAPVGQVLAIVSNPQSGVKAEELEWSGLKQWLAQQTKPVTKAEVQAFLDANQIQVKEVLLGDSFNSYEEFVKKMEAKYGYGYATERLTPSEQETQMLLWEKGQTIPRGDRQTKFGTYTLPGGENYRELLLTLPARGDVFDPGKVEIKRHRQSVTQGNTSIWYDGKKIIEYSDDPQLTPSGLYLQKPEAHWMDVARGLFERGDRINKVKPKGDNFAGGHYDEPNVLAHIRFNDRTDSQGRKVLFVEEVQSDWHQKGRREGYAKKPLTPAALTFDGIEPGTETNEKPKYWYLLPNGETNTLGDNRVPGWGTSEDEARADAATMASVNRNIGLPDAPFKTTWPELAMKRMLNWAATHGQSDAWLTITKPQSVRELGENVFGREMAAMMSLDAMDSGVLTALKHDQIRRAVIADLSVNVVNDLTTVKATPQQLLSEPDVVISRLTPDHARSVAVGLLRAARGVGARLRTKLLSAESGRSDVELLPALKASDLSPREVVSVLAPERLSGERGSTRPGETGPAATRTETAETGLTGKRSELNPARLAAFLNWHHAIIGGSGAPYEHGYDVLAWTTGEQQNERYDLSKQIKEVFAVKLDGDAYDLTVTDLNNQAVYDTARTGPIPIAKVEELIGKEMADKIQKQDAKSPITYEGLDLKVGGAGMKGFYDQILPRFLDRYGKAWGVHTHDVRIELPITVPEARQRGVEVRTDKAIVDLETVHGILITDKARDAALKGQPLFQGPRGSVEFTESGQAVIRALENPNVSTGLHETAHVARRFLFDRSLPQEMREGITDDDILTAEDWAGAKDGEWNRKAEEKFARGFERYMADGQAPSASLKTLFAKFARWLAKVYQKIAGSPIDVEISPAMRQVFDRLITRSERLQQAEATGDTSFNVEDFERDVETLYQDDDQFALRQKYQDGRSIPVEGDEVYQTVAGFGGSPAYVYGTIYKRGPQLRVRITGSDSMFGGGVQGAKTYALSPAWTMRGDPEVARREQARAKARREQDEQYDTGRRDRAMSLKQQTDAAITAGHQPLTTDTPVGSHVRDYQQGRDAWVVSQGKYGPVLGEQDRIGDEYGGYTIGKPQNDRWDGYSVYPDDVLPTGEEQPRLPGAEAVREQDIQTPEFEAPFALTGEVSKAKKGRQETLFQEGEPPQRGKTITERDIQRIAEKRGIGAEFVRVQAEKAGYQIVADDTRPPLPPDTPVDADEYFNFKRVQLSEEETAALKAEIETVVRQTGRSPKERVTFAEIRRDAQALGPDAVKMLAPFREAQQQFRAVRMAARQRINALNRRIILDQRSLDALPEEDRGTVQRNLQQMEQDRRTLLDVWMRMRSEDGRNLAMHRMMADSTWEDGRGFDHAYWLSRARRALGLPPGMDLPVTVSRKLNDILSRGDQIAATGEGSPVAVQQELADLLTELDRDGWLEIIATLRKAGLLTGIKTHLRNLGGNTGFQIAEELSRVPAAMIDMALSTMTGRRTVQGISPTAVARATQEAATKGVAQAVDVLRSGSFRDDLHKSEVRRELNSGYKWLDAYANFVFRTMGAEDRVFKSYAFRRSLEEQVKLRAVNTGENPIDLLLQPSEEMITQAIADADFATFNNPNVLAQAVGYGMGALRRMGPAGRGAAFGVELVAPFRNTPSNVLARVIDYTPVGAGVRATQAAVAATIKKAMTPEQQRAFSLAIGRGVIGSALITAGWLLAKAGLATGTSDEDQGDRAVASAARRLPGAVLVDGVWRQIAPFSPAGNLITIGATMYRQSSRRLTDEAKRLGRIVGAATKVVLDQPMLTGLQDMIEALENPGQRAEAVTGSMAGSFVPTIVNDAAALFDPYRRDARPEGLSDSLEKGLAARLPGLRNSLPQRYDVLGRPEAQTGGAALWDPTIATVAREMDDTVLTALIAHDVGIAWPSRQPQETDAHYRTRARVVGRQIDRVLRIVVASQPYQTTTPEVQQRMLERGISAARETVPPQIPMPALQQREAQMPVPQAW